ncbi:MULTISPECIES: antA/AntB antirepressor family protein [Providencia]|uniref:antA/AntB antirepressor family protein n=1 Tax=Providencia TaxID=586 RepID=UPI00140E7F62|nr:MULTISPECIES: antA/AntB antirepressor family protein [Providencia]MBQ0372094.1 antA/AntB antirepressor family protein [Providencia rettgeri]MBT0660556.1 antA/AntB antirepressor family protein [Providencia rettgeri]MCB4856585.1 antA/AntB antirepressor family protein [Providencia rettgeri]MCD6316795.1 antA/AntB antirepressor family protein [Providencia rettgeri]MCG9518606.1 antA/AntB antirepressor family protein [Providencia rettgeri]
MKNKMTVMGQGFAHPENHSSDIKELSFAELLPISHIKVGGLSSSVVSARSLHEALGVGRVFSSWFKSRTAQYTFIENTDYFNCGGLINDQLTPERVEINKVGRPESDYWITTNTAKELAMVERTEQGRLIRQYFIKCEEALHKVAPTITKQLRHQLKSRLKVASYFKPMCSALELARMEQGKNTLPHHYTTESNMLNRIVLGGLTAKAWAKQNGIIGNPRDAMSETQLEHLSYLEQTNTTLIELGMDYHARKDKLIGLSQKWLAQRVEVAQ